MSLWLPYKRSYICFPPVNLTLIGHFNCRAAKGARRGEGASSPPPGLAEPKPGQRADRRLEGSSLCQLSWPLRRWNCRRLPVSKKQPAQEQL